MKDYVFRSFWDRDECHSLLERLRTDAEKERTALYRKVEAVTALYADEDAQLPNNVSFKLASARKGVCNVEISDGIFWW